MIRFDRYVGRPTGERWADCRVNLQRVDPQIELQRRPAAIETSAQTLPPRPRPERVDGIESGQYCGHSLQTQTEVVAQGKGLVDETLSRLGTLLFETHGQIVKVQPG